jgi:uncharacterized protein
MSTKTTTQGAVDTVRQWYEFVLAGDLESAGAMMRDDFVLHEPPALPYGGEYHGVAGFFEIMGRINEQFETSLAAPVEYFDATDPVVIHLVGRFTSRATGEAVKMNVVELYYVRDGKIAELDVYYKDPGAIAAIAG